MSLSYFGADLELKTVDVGQRIISGYAAAHNNIDRVRDIIDPAASVKTVRRLGKPADVAVFIGHDSTALPVGIPQKIEATPTGLYTETYILRGAAGDNLLAVAKDLQDHGESLGMSIGYRTMDSRPDRVQGKMVRRILDYDLKEYSYGASQVIANPAALVHAVKTRRKALGEGQDTAGGALVPTDRKGAAMQYRVNQAGDTWQVIRDMDDDADEDDNRLVGSYDSEALANAVAAALRAEQGEPRDDDADQAGKTGGAVNEQKAVWTDAMMNDLPDSSFLYVEDGGVKDSSGRTVPRAKRHFPYKDADGKVDLPHLRNAIARIPQARADGLDAAKKAQLQARARMLLDKANGDGKTLDPDGPEWKAGAPIALRALGCRLLDLAETLAEEQKAMVLLGEDTKGGARIRGPLREQLAAIATDISTTTTWAATIERGEDGRAQIARLQAELALTEF